MGRNLYILAATLGALALLSIALSFTNIAQQPGSLGDASLCCPAQASPNELGPFSNANHSS